MQASLRIPTKRLCADWHIVEINWQLASVACQRAAQLACASKSGSVHYDGARRLATRKKQRESSQDRTPSRIAGKIERGRKHWTFASIKAIKDAVPYRLRYWTFQALKPT